MKTQVNMSMSEMMNFDREVVNYINDNLEYIKENAITNDSDLAKEALNHYNLTVEAFNDEESFLSEEQEERFYNVAKRLFNQGFVEHAGTLLNN